MNRVSEPGASAVILGARSVMAASLARQLASDGWSLALGARRSCELEPLASDLRLRFECQVELFEFDALDYASSTRLPDRLRDRCGDYDLVFCFTGYMGDQQQVRTDAEEMRRTFETNFVGVAMALSYFANYFEERRSGGMVAVTSVAGDRGRQSNYAYGAAKAGLNTFLQGLRNRLAPCGVHVMTVKPGFVDTPMTEDLEGLFLVASPDRVAADILRAYRRRKNVVFTPWFWRYIMSVIRLIPEELFKRLKL